ncbi:MAG: autoinducer synthase [Rhodobacterales bacterium]|nr:MAG: autoinducer synthase [Rhodobacterales bacterium]
MKLHVFDLSTAHEHGTVLWDFLRLRKKYFVDELGWDIPHDDQVEMDQYDTPQAFYSVITHLGEVVGGARCMPTTSRWGSAGYMLGDARAGLLPGIPETIVPAGYEGPGIMEATRLVIEDHLNAAERTEVLDLLVEGIVSESLNRGAHRIIALSHVTLVRAIRKLGYDPEQCGPTYRDPSSGKPHAVLTMEPWKVGERPKAAPVAA